VTLPRRTYCSVRRAGAGFLALTAVVAAVVSATVAGPAAARPIGSFDVGGAIEKEYDRAGGAAVFGNPIGPEQNAAKGGKFQVFERSISIYWSLGTDARYVGGLIRDAWGQSGWENGPLGFPISDEQPAGRDGAGRYSMFDGGSIYWSPDTGAHAVWGAIHDMWMNSGAEKGRYGYPTGDEYDNHGGKAQAFQGGTISWHP
jgi:uncharacterized protein with LGFP repeats